MCHICLLTLGIPGQTHPKDSINLQKTLVSISMQKICFINHFFRQILQRYYILTLNTLGIPGHTHQMFQAKYHILCFFAANSINLDEYK